MSLFGKKKEEKKDDTSVKAQVEEKVEKKPSVKKASAKKDATPSTTASVVDDVLIAPLVTEKTHLLATSGKYVFRVKRSATKRTVKFAVENAHDVHVENVHMVKIPAKRRTVKYNRGYQSVGKKAIVTLKKGETIALFETV